VNKLSDNTLGIDLGEGRTTGSKKFLETYEEGIVEIKKGKHRFSRPYKPSFNAYSEGVSDLLEEEEKTTPSIENGTILILRVPWGRGETRQSRYLAFASSERERNSVVRGEEFMRSSGEG